jgi:hypothetical protein
MSCPTSIEPKKKSSEHDSEQVWNQHFMQNPSLGEKIVWHLTSKKQPNHQAFEARLTCVRDYNIPSDPSWIKKH